MPNDDDVTLGELGRLIRGLDRKITDIPNNFLALQVWSVEKAAFERSINGLGREIGELRSEIRATKTEKSAEHDAFELALQQEKEARQAAVRDLEAANTRKEAEVRKERAQRLVAVGLAVLSAVLGIIGTVVGASVLAALNGGAA
jgi:hypothetical protein